MIQCPTCKQELEAGVRFCPHDGTPLMETTSALPTRTPSEPASTGAAQPHRELQLPVVIGGRYRLTQLRGGGGMAKVYRAVDVTLEREVAVKLINAELRNESEFDARFQREARIASQLNDPHIVVVHDFGIDAAHGPFLVMEHLQGQSLREWLQSEGPLPYCDGLQLSAQLLLALVHAHSKGIVHRDIKPDNIFLLNQSGVRLHTRVLDFGIARILRRGEKDSAATLTNPGEVLGTPRYMSPEQLAGQPLDARSDLYSAALVIYEALTGQLPYVTGKKLSELCSEASPSLQDLLDRCLKPNPAERPASAGEAYLRLQELSKASGVLPLPPAGLDKPIASWQEGVPTVAYTPSPLLWWTRRRLLAGIGTLLLLLGLTVLLKAIFHKPPPVDPQFESLLGVKIGDPRHEVVGKLQLTKGGPMNPWARARTPHYLGNILRVKDLKLSQDSLDQLDVLLSADERVCVIFFDDRVRAVIAHRGQTGRGLKIGGSVRQIMEHYIVELTADASFTVRGEGENRVAIRSYPALGIGFEVSREKIVAVTLYPAADEP